jgi:hypothetical protein
MGGAVSVGSHISGEVLILGLVSLTNLQDACWGSLHDDGVTEPGLG